MGVCQNLLFVEQVIRAKAKPHFMRLSVIGARVVARRGKFFQNPDTNGSA